LYKWFNLLTNMDNNENAGDDAIEIFQPAPLKVWAKGSILKHMRFDQRPVVDHGRGVNELPLPQLLRKYIMKITTEEYIEMMTAMGLVDKIYDGLGIIRMCEDFRGSDNTITDQARMRLQSAVDGIVMIGEQPITVSSSYTTDRCSVSVIDLASILQSVLKRFHIDDIVDDLCIDRMSYALKSHYSDKVPDYVRTLIPTIIDKCLSDHKLVDKLLIALDITGSHPDLNPLLTKMISTCGDKTDIPFLTSLLTRIQTLSDENLSSLDTLLQKETKKLISRSDELSGNISHDFVVLVLLLTHFPKTYLSQLSVDTRSDLNKLLELYMVKWDISNDIDKYSIVHLICLVGDPLLLSLSREGMNRLCSIGTEVHNSQGYGILHDKMDKTINILSSAHKMNEIRSLGRESSTSSVSQNVSNSDASKSGNGNETMLSHTERTSTTRASQEVEDRRLVSTELVNRSPASQDASTVDRSRSRNGNESNLSHTERERLNSDRRDRSPSFRL